MVLARTCPRELLGVETAVLPYGRWAVRGRTPFLVMVHEMTSRLAPDLWVSGSMVHGRSLVGADSVRSPRPGGHAQVGHMEPMVHDDLCWKIATWAGHGMATSAG